MGDFLRVIFGGMFLLHMYWMFRFSKGMQVYEFVNDYLLRHPNLYPDYDRMLRGAVTFHGFWGAIWGGLFSHIALYRFGIFNAPEALRTLIIAGFAIGFGVSFICVLINFKRIGPVPKIRYTKRQHLSRLLIWAFFIAWVVYRFIIGE